MVVLISGGAGLAGPDVQSGLSLPSPSSSTLPLTNLTTIHYTILTIIHKSCQSDNLNLIASLSPLGITRLSGVSFRSIIRYPRCGASISLPSIVNSIGLLHLESVPSMPSSITSYLYSIYFCSRRICYAPIACSVK